MLTSRTLDHVIAEANRGDFKHGKIPDDPNRALVVLVREVGEVADALPHENSQRKADTSAEHVYTELIQVAAVALRWAQEVGFEIDLKRVE